MAATRYAQAVQKDTKDFITTALMQLLSKENISTLTVSQVCKRAGVSRMAFYRNYDSLEQILYEYFQPKLADVFITIRQNSQDYIKFDGLLKFFNTFSDFLLLSFDRGFEPIIERIFLEEMGKFYAKNEDEYWTAFISAGVYAIWRKWLLDGQKKPLKEITEFLKKCNGIKTSAYS